MSYENQLKTILENLVYHKDVNSAIDCIYELNEEYNMTPGVMVTIKEMSDHFYALEKDSGEIIIAGPSDATNHRGRCIKINNCVESSPETYTDDLKRLEHDYKTK